jgi:RNA polymerase sigma-B factor
VIAHDSVEAHDLSKVMFARLRELEEGTYEYQYVRNTLIELNLTLVRYAARRFQSRSAQLDDIMQVGTIGLIKAVDHFDIQRGVEFTSFALPTIVGEMKRFFRDTSWAAHVPRRLQEARIDIARATEALGKRLGRDPTAAELADELHLTEAEIVEAQAVTDNAYTASSLDATTTDDESEAALAAHLGHVDPSLERVDNLISLKPLIAELDERDRMILSLRFGDELTQAEIADRIGVSQMHVCRLLKRILATLREGLLAEASS